MEHIDESTMAQALLSAPGWARVGLAAPTEWMREQAAVELARSILDQAKADARPMAVQDRLL